ncbi:uracil-DNA glycosylase [Hyphomicrobium sp.]|uniref:uracil-DNA glycosylase n=1 Tax=Hyphomicrobium sp. TaxID=82 RepID=UPI0025BF8919|nr:uracil-DNA glycosylase [Hyphomicrobium sp.]MCC7250689.1 uracil-DNA glycosylase [Hyphomicrobium sp.]
MVPAPSPSLSSFPPEAPRDCPRCPRLVAFREEAARAEPTWFNGAVPSFGTSDARLLIVGLAPGLRGANRTGRPFTGDYAGELLYSTLLAFGFARGTYRADPADGLMLVDCMITNAVRCVPPENKPLPSEVATCRGFFSARLAALPRLRALVVLGRVAHEQTLATLALKKSQFPFRHGARHVAGPLTLFDSLHCSRLNTNTGRLTTEMFHDVFRDVRAFLDELPAKK